MSSAMELVPIAEAQPVLAPVPSGIGCKYTTGGVPKVGTPENDLYYFKISILLFYRFSHNISALCPRFSALPALRALLAAELLIGTFPVHH